MIRPVQPSDLPAVGQLAVSSGLFPEAESDVVTALMNDYFAAPAIDRQQQRLLLVETSGVPGFALTRAFYDKAGYTAETRVRDYYEVGDDMVLFRKDLTAEPPA